MLSSTSKPECYSSYWFLSPISCLTYHTGATANLIILLPIFSASLVFLCDSWDSTLHIKCEAAYKYLLTYWFYIEFGTATEAVISVRYALRSKKTFYCRFSIIYEVGPVADETIERHPLLVVNILHDISR